MNDKKGIERVFEALTDKHQKDRRLPANMALVSFSLKFAVISRPRLVCSPGKEPPASAGLAGRNCAESPSSASNGVLYSPACTDTCWSQSQREGKIKKRKLRSAPCTSCLPAVTARTEMQIGRNKSHGERGHFGTRQRRTRLKATARARPRDAGNAAARRREETRRASPGQSAREPTLTSAIMAGTTRKVIRSK